MLLFISETQLITNVSHIKRMILNFSLFKYNLNCRNLEYAPPGSAIESIAKFESTLKELEGYGLEVSIIRHVNCDVGASPLDHKTQKLPDICNIYQCGQLIRQPSRTT